MKVTKEDCLKMQGICRNYLQAYTTNQPNISTFVASNSLIFESEVEARDVENRLIKAQETRLTLLKKKMQETYAAFYNYITSGVEINKTDLQKLANALLVQCDNTDSHPFSIIDMEYQILFGAVQSISRFLLRREMEERNVTAA